MPTHQQEDLAKKRAKPRHARTKKKKPGRKKKKPTGRRALPTKQLRERVAGLLRMGNYVETVCNKVGVPKSTFYEWLKKGEERPGTRYALFLDAVREAQADAEAGLVLTITKAASDGDWKAAAHLLERKFPDRWGRHQRIEHSISSEQGAILIVPDNGRGPPAEEEEGDET